MALRLHGLTAMLLEMQWESRVTSDSQSPNILGLCGYCQPPHFPLCCSLSTSWPQIRQDYLLNLSILLSGGRETNKDSPSNGERRGNSSNLKSPLFSMANCSFEKYFPNELTLPKLLGTARHRGWQPHTLQGSIVGFPRVRLFGIAAQNGCKLHLKLNAGMRLIANTCRKEKMKSTLKRELKSTWNRWKGREWS